MLGWTTSLSASGNRVFRVYEVHNHYVIVPAVSCALQFRQSSSRLETWYIRLLLICLQHSSRFQRLQRVPFGQRCSLQCSVNQCPPLHGCAPALLIPVPAKAVSHDDFGSIDLPLCPFFEERTSLARGAKAYVEADDVHVFCSRRYAGWRSPRGREKRRADLEGAFEDCTGGLLAR